MRNCDIVIEIRCLQFSIDIKWGFYSLQNVLSRLIAIVVTSPRIFILNTREEEKEPGFAGGNMTSRKACWVSRYQSSLMYVHFADKIVK